MESQILYTKNIYHLGDCIYSLIFFYNINDYLIANNIIIYFYCNNEYYPQINDFNNLNNVKIRCSIVLSSLMHPINKPSCHTC